MRSAGSLRFWRSDFQLGRFAFKYSRHPFRQRTSLRLSAFHDLFVDRRRLISLSLGLFFCGVWLFGARADPVSVLLSRKSYEEGGLRHYSSWLMALMSARWYVHCEAGEDLETGWGGQCIHVCDEILIPARRCLHTGRLCHAVYTNVTFRYWLHFVICFIYLILFSKYPCTSFMKGTCNVALFVSLLL